MIKWYDWLAAFIVADSIQTVIFAPTSNFWISILYGFVIVLLLDIWNYYCIVRKHNES